MQAVYGLLSALHRVMLLICLLHDVATHDLAAALERRNVTVESSMI